MSSKEFLLSPTDETPELGYEKYHLTIGYYYNDPPFGVGRPKHVYGFAKSNAGSISPNPINGTEIIQVTVDRNTAGNCSAIASYKKDKLVYTDFYYRGVKYSSADKYNNAKLNPIVNEWSSLNDSTIEVWLKIP